MTSQPVPMPCLQESILQETKDNMRSTTEMANNRSATRTLQNRSESRDEVRTRNNLNSDHLERCFKVQLNIEDRDNSLEKKCKRTMEMAEVANSKTNVDRIEESYTNSTKSSINPGKGSNSSSEGKTAGLKDVLLENLGPLAPQISSGLSWSFVSSWQNSNMNSKFQSFCGAKEARYNDSERSYKPPIAKDTNAATDPFIQPFHELNPGPSTYNNVYCRKMDNSACTVHQSCYKIVNKTASAEAVSTGQDALEVNNKEDNSAKDRGKTGKEFSLMWKLSNFPNEKDKHEEGGILDWFSKVPGRMLGVTAAKGYVDNNKAKPGTKQPEHHQGTNEFKFKNCNLELSPREVNEVLAVLRARTPSGRRRATVKNVKRRDRSERAGEEAATEKMSPRCANIESANVTTSRVKPSEVYDCKSLYKEVDSLSGEPTAVLDRVYYDKNVYQSAYSKFSDSSRLEPRTDVCANGDAERLRNVSNKADVLLGAILRNGSRDRKGQLDVSNGTRPRSTTSIDDDDSDDPRASLEKLNQDHRVAGAVNDEKSLPLAVNKRFNKIRQLFKKEDDKRTTITENFAFLDSDLNLWNPTQCPSSALLHDNNEQPANLHNSAKSKTKRRIDFSNFPETAEKNGLATTPGLSTKDAHQKPPIHSTNSIDDRECDSAGLNQQSNCDRLSIDARELIEDERDNTSERDTTVPPKNNLTTATTPQNGHSSSKARNNSNHKDGVAEDDETLDRSVPSALEQERFRRSLENAASMVFHSRTGLPLTSSPAPLRRGSCCFDYDSSLNSVSSKRRYDVEELCFPRIFFQPLVNILFHFTSPGRAVYIEPFLGGYQ